MYSLHVKSEKTPGNIVIVWRYVFSDASDGDEVSAVIAMPEWMYVYHLLQTAVEVIKARLWFTAANFTVGINIDTVYTSSKGLRCLPAIYGSDYGRLG